MKDGVRLGSRAWTEVRAQLSSARAERSFLTVSAGTDEEPETCLLYLLRTDVRTGYVGEKTGKSQEENGSRSR